MLAAIGSIKHCTRCAEKDVQPVVRILHILAVVAFLGTCAVLSTCLRQRYADDLQLEEIQDYPTAVERFREGDGGNRDLSAEMIAPLIVEARAFASYVNSTSPAPDGRSPTSQMPARNRPTPAVRPKASSVPFKLHGTSVCPDQPERSMALISEPGGSEGERKWVREGSALGHFVVQEIRRGVVVLSDGDAVREMTVEPGPSRRNLVRSYTASVARANAGGPPERLEADSNAVAEPATR